MFIVTLPLELLFYYSIKSKHKIFNQNENYIIFCNLEKEIFITSVYGNELKIIQSEIVVILPEIDYNNFILNQVKSVFNEYVTKLMLELDKRMPPNLRFMMSFNVVYQVGYVV